MVFGNGNGRRCACKGAASEKSEGIVDQSTDNSDIGWEIEMKVIRHFQTITRHKLLVMKYCFQVGLYKQGLLHDLSKYTWAEFSVGCKYYQGTRSPNNAEREDI